MNLYQERLCLITLQTTAAIQAFFIAMSLYPDVQAKAQTELDHFVGANRLPTFDDYEILVYIRAVVLETLRWLPVGPLGLPHSTTRDDEYKGMLIPKGTIVFPVSFHSWSDSSSNQFSG